MTRQEVLEIAEAQGFLSTKNFPGSKSAIRQHIAKLQQLGLICRIGYGKYKLTTDGQAAVVDKHFQKLESVRSKHYPGWQTTKAGELKPVEDLTPEQAKRTVTWNLSATDPKPQVINTPPQEPESIDWQREYIKLANKLADAAGGSK